MSYTKSYILEYYSVKEQVVGAQPPGMSRTEYINLSKQLKAGNLSQADYDKALSNFTSNQSGSANIDSTYNVGGVDVGTSLVGQELKAAENIILGKPDPATGLRPYSDLPAVASKFSKDIGTNIQSGIQGGVDYATSLPTLGKVALGATLAGAGAAAGAGLVNRAFRKRTEKKKKKKTLNEYNPYSQRLTPAATGGAAGATVGTLSGLLGGKAAAKALTSALKVTNPALATTIDIIGQGFGTAIGGGVGGYGGYEIGKALTPKKKKKRNPLLPSYYDQA